MIRKWERLVYIVSMLAVVVAGVWYIDHTQARNDRRWCSLMTTLDEGYSAGTPTTVIGRKLREDVKALRVGLGC